MKMLSVNYTSFHCLFYAGRVESLGQFESFLEKNILWETRINGLCD